MGDAVTCPASLELQDAGRHDPERRDRSDWRVPMLSPAAVSTRWFAEHVHGKALVLALRPRIRFVGHEGDCPKDMMISLYGLRAGFALWRWK